MNIYDSGIGFDPLASSVKKLASEIDGNVWEEGSDYEISLVYSTSTSNEAQEIKQRCHRDTEHKKDEKSFPLIVYVPIGNNSFEICVLPSNREFEKDLKITSQRRMKIDIGECF